MPVRSARGKKKEGRMKRGGKGGEERKDSAQAHRIGVIEERTRKKMCLL
jgi:hypothetical protein